MCCFVLVISQFQSKRKSATQFKIALQKPFRITNNIIFHCFIKKNNATNIKSNSPQLYYSVNRKNFNHICGKKNIKWSYFIIQM